MSISYSQFSELKGSVTTTDFVQDDGTTFQLNAITGGFGNGGTPSYLGGSWACSYSGSPIDTQAYLNLNQAIDVFINYADGTRLRYRVFVTTDSNTGSTANAGRNFSSEHGGSFDYVFIVIRPANNLPAQLDTEKPVITLVGDASISINKGDTYTEQGATWTDNVDGSGNATIGGDTVDTSTLGTYVVKYNYTDAAGNVATEVTRTVVVENRAFITHVLDGADTYYSSTRSNYYVRGFGISDNRSLYNWVKTQPHTVIVAENGSGKGGVMGSYNTAYGEIIEPDFDMKVQVSHATNGISEVTVDRITYGTTGSGLGSGTNFTIKSPEHLHAYPSYIVYDETLDFNPTTTNITIIDGGSGYTSPGTDAPTTGGSGTGLKVSYTVGDDGGIENPTVTDDGTGYQDGDEVEIPGGTTNATLLIDVPGGVDTTSILYNIGRTIKTAISNAGTGSDNYSEMTYGGGNLTLVETWTDSGKGTKLGSKAFTYQSGQLVTVVEKDGSDTTTLTKTLTYDGDGNLDSITKDYA